MRRHPVSGGLTQNQHGFDRVRWHGPQQLTARYQSQRRGNGGNQHRAPCFPRRVNRNKARHRRRVESDNFASGLWGELSLFLAMHFRVIANCLPCYLFVSGRARIARNIGAGEVRAAAFIRKSRFPLYFSLFLRAAQSSYRARPQAGKRQGKPIICPMTPPQPCFSV